MSTDTINQSETMDPDIHERRLQLRSGLHVLPHGDDEVFVREGSRSAFSKIIRDPRRRMILARILQSATEPTSAASISETLQLPVSDVHEVLEQLLEADVLQPADRAPHVPLSIALIGDGQLSKWTWSGLAPHDNVTVKNIAADTEVVEGDDGVLDDAGLVVVATDYLQPGLNQIVNQRIHDVGVPALFSHIDGTEIVVGPLTVPGQSACYLCFDVQDEGARHLRDEYLVYKDNLRTNKPIGDVASEVAFLAAGWVNLAISKFDPECPDFLVNRVLRVETSKMEVMTHRILQIPRCPVCSNYRPDLQHTFL